MFNGIIYKTGKILKIIKNKYYSELVLKTNFKFICGFNVSKYISLLQFFGRPY